MKKSNEVKNSVRKGVLDVECYNADRFRNEMRQVALSDVPYFMATGDRRHIMEDGVERTIKGCSFIPTEKGRFVTTASIVELGELLPEGFGVASNDYLVNFSHVRELKDGYFWVKKGELRQVIEVGKGYEGVEGKFREWEKVGK